MKPNSVLFLILPFHYCNIQGQGIFWKELPNGNEFFDMRCIYQDSTTNSLYVGIKQRVIGGDSVNLIARLKNGSWESIGQGAGCCGGTYISTIINYHDTLFAGGQISQSEGNPGSGIMKWNGNSWVQVGSGGCEGTHKILGSEGFVNSLREINDKLYVVGMYDTIGCQLANGIATWDGSIWETVHDFPNNGSGCCNNITGAVLYNSQIYVGGYFHSVDSTGDDIAFYNGSEWQTVGGGLHGSLAGIWDLLVYKNKLYIAGRFTMSDGNPGNNIIVWDGTQWNDLQGGTNYAVRDLLIYHDKLYAFGEFTNAGGLSSLEAAVWDGTKWCSIPGNIMNGAINCSGIYNDSILIGGGFKIYQGDTIQYFASYLYSDYVDTCGIALGTSEIQSPNFSFSLYPNPTQNFLSLYSDQFLHSITITNLLGEIVFHQSSIHQKQLELDVADFPPGVYFLEAESDGKRGIRKFVKE